MVVVGHGRARRTHVVVPELGNSAFTSATSWCSSPMKDSAVLYARSWCRKKSSEPSRGSGRSSTRGRAAQSKEAMNGSGIEPQAGHGIPSGSRGSPRHSDASRGAKAAR